MNTSWVGSEPEDCTRIDIRLPLPMEVASALTRAIGAMWPGATIANDPHGLAVRVPKRRPKRVPQRQFKEILADVLDGTGDGPEVTLARWSENAPTLALDSKDEAWQALATWAVICLTAQDAPNYVEQTVTYTDVDDTIQTIAVSCARSKRQTPHALRVEADAKVERLQQLREEDAATIRDLRAQLANAEAKANRFEERIHRSSH